MKRIPLLRIDSVDGPGPGSLRALSALLEAFATEGLRWAHLVWRPSAVAAAAEEASEGPLSAGCHKTVRIEDGRSVAIKALAGAAVFRDVLREHFRGQGVVLIEGELPADVTAPRITAAGDGRFLIETGESERRFDAREVIAELRRARPFDPK